MRADAFHPAGQPLSIEQVPDPAPRPGEAMVSPLQTQTGPFPKLLPTPRPLRSEPAQRKVLINQGLRRSHD